MNRRIGTSIIAAVAALGLASCSGSPTEPTAPSASVEAPATDTTTAAETTTESTEPATETESTTPAGTDAQQTVADACVSMAGPLAEASNAIADIASVATADAQVAVDAWTELVEAYRKAADTVLNPEVKAAASAVQEDVATMRDALQKAYVDQDMTAVSEVTEATTEFQASMTELQTLCIG